MVVVPERGFRRRQIPHTMRGKPVGIFMHRLRLGDVADYRSQIESKKFRIYSSAKLKNVTAILPNRLLGVVAVFFRFSQPELKINLRISYTPCIFVF